MGDRDDKDVRAEIEFHVDRATQENLASGMSPAEARAEALRRFGSVEKVRKDCLAIRGRRVPTAVGLAAVVILATVSFLSGYAVRDRRASSNETRLVEPYVVGYPPRIPDATLLQRAPSILGLDARIYKVDWSEDGLRIRPMKPVWVPADSTTDPPK